MVLILTAVITVGFAIWRALSAERTRDTSIEAAKGSTNKRDLTVVCLTKKRLRMKKLEDKIAKTKGFKTACADAPGIDRMDRMRVTHSSFHSTVALSSKVCFGAPLSRPFACGRM
eukprot:GHVN01097127.1.p1 GENE.GHVN01097127.1~~GHVN01097127.1.p1  ORF type:complete len:115 (-),score=11.38 GHVN01097127.1:810-1154(-)